MNNSNIYFLDTLGTRTDPMVILQDVASGSISEACLALWFDVDDCGNAASELGDQS